MARKINAAHVWSTIVPFPVSETWAALLSELPVLQGSRAIAGAGSGGRCSVADGKAVSAEAKADLPQPLEEEDTGVVAPGSLRVGAVSADGKVRLTGAKLEAYVEWSEELAAAAAAAAAATVSRRVSLARLGAGKGETYVEWMVSTRDDAVVTHVDAQARQVMAAVTARCSALTPVTTPDGLPACCVNVMIESEHPLQTQVKQYLAAHGTLLLANVGSGRKLTVAPSDNLYPVCASGENRSQVLREVFKRGCGSRFQGSIALAHAAINGIDPYFDDFLSATAPTAQAGQDPNYEAAFGHPRDLRAGETEFAFGEFYEPGHATLRNAGVWYLRNFYGSGRTRVGTRRVYVAFEKTVHAVVKRLVDAHQRFREDLSNVVVIAIPVGDVIAHPESGAAPKSVEAYQEAAKLFEQFFDFTATQ